MPGNQVNGQDVFEVYEVAKEAVDRARRGEGPSLLVCLTHRQRGHEEGDPQTYREKENIELAKRLDPLILFKDKVLGEKMLTEEELGAIEKEVKAQVDEAVEFALKSPLPEPEEAEKYVFVEVDQHA